MTVNETCTCSYIVPAGFGRTGTCQGAVFGMFSTHMRAEDHAVLLAPKGTELHAAGGDWHLFAALGWLSDREMLVVTEHLTTADLHLLGLPAALASSAWAAMSWRDIEDPGLCLNPEQHPEFEISALHDTVTTHTDTTTMETTGSRIHTTVRLPATRFRAEPTTAVWSFDAERRTGLLRFPRRWDLPDLRLILASLPTGVAIQEDELYQRIDGHDYVLIQ